jgi:hypothetical protein
MVLMDSNLSAFLQKASTKENPYIKEIKDDIKIDRE